MNRTPIKGSNHEVIISTPVRATSLQKVNQALNNFEDLMNVSQGKGDSAFQLYCQQNLSPINSVNSKIKQLKTPDSAYQVPHSQRSGFKPSKGCMMSPFVNQNMNGLSKFYIPSSTIPPGSVEEKISQNQTQLGQMNVIPPTSVSAATANTDVARSLSTPANSRYHGLLVPGSLIQEPNGGASGGSKHAGGQLKHGLPSLPQQDNKFYIFQSPLFKVKFAGRNELESFFDSGDIHKGLIEDFNFMGCRSQSVLKAQPQQQAPLSMSHHERAYPNQAYKRVIQFDENESQDLGEAGVISPRNMESSSISQPIQNLRNGFEKLIETHVQAQAPEVINSKLIISHNMYNQESMHPHQLHFSSFYGYPPYPKQPQMAVLPYIATENNSNSMTYGINEYPRIEQKEEREESNLVASSVAASVAAKTNVTSAVIKLQKKQSQTKNASKRKLFESPESKNIPSPQKKQKPNESAVVETILSTEIHAAENKENNIQQSQDGQMNVEETENTENLASVAVEVGATTIVEEGSQAPGQSNCQATGEKKICCNCKRTKCLKLYCECFAASRMCEGCSCQGCFNRPEFEEMRQEARAVILERNMLAFSSKIDNQNKAQQQSGEEGIENEEKAHSKGCNCKRSNCLKKYCECFQLGVKCSKLCKCENCKNTSGSNSNNPDDQAEDIRVGTACSHEVAGLASAQTLPSSLKKSTLKQQTETVAQYNVPSFNYYCQDGYYPYYYPDYGVPTVMPASVTGAAGSSNGFPYYNDYFAYNTPQGIIPDNEGQVPKQIITDFRKVLPNFDPVPVAVCSSAQPDTEGIQSVETNEKVEIVEDTNNKENAPKIGISEAGMKTISSKKTKRPSRSSKDGSSANKDTIQIRNELKKKNAVILSKTEDDTGGLKLDFSKELLVTQNQEVKDAKKTHKEVENSDLIRNALEIADKNIQVGTKMTEEQVAEVEVTATAKKVGSKVSGEIPAVKSDVVIGNLEKQDGSLAVITPAKKKNSRSTKAPIIKETIVALPLSLNEGGNTIVETEQNVTATKRHSSRLSGTKRTKIQPQEQKPSDPVTDAGIQ